MPGTKQFEKAIAALFNLSYSLFYISDKKLSRVQLPGTGRDLFVLLAWVRIPAPTKATEQDQIWAHLKLL